MPDSTDKTFSALLAEAAERDGYKVEWYSGKIVMQASASAFHNLLIMEIGRQFPREAWWVLPDMGVGIPGDHRGPQPDIVIIPAGSLNSDENPISRELVAMVCEIVSKSTRAEDYCDKPETYAEMRIPIYVIVDLHNGLVRVLSEPENGKYTRQTESAIGKPFQLPAPIGLEIETLSFPHGS